MLLDELLRNFPFVVCTIIIQRHDLGIVLMGIVIGNLFIITYASSFPTILQAMYMYAVKYSNAFDYEFSFPLNK